MADTIAELMVKIGGDASGLKKATSDAEKSVASLGKSLSSVGKGLTIGVTAPILAIGAAAMKASSDVNGAYRQIQRETGATGKELEDLKTQFKTVFSTVPASADEVATALSRITQTLNTTTTVTGELAKQFLNLSRITETDLTTNIDSATASFNAWGENIGPYGQALDALYVISTNTGQSISDITPVLAKSAGAAQQAGLSYEQTAIIIAQMGQAGIPPRQIYSALNAVITDSIKNNKNAAVSWQELITKFKDPAYRATADDMAILQGNTVSFANAAKNGALDYNDLLQKIKESPDAINAMAAATRGLGENLQVLRNRMKLALAPLGSAISKAADASLKSLNPLFVGIENLGKQFEKLPPQVQQSVVAFGALASAVGPALVTLGNAMPVFEKLGGSLKGLSGKTGITGLLTSTVGMIPAWGLIAAGVVTVGVALGTAYATSSRFRALLGELGGIATQFGSRLGTAFEKLTSGDWKGALNEVKVGLQEAFDSLKKIDWRSAMATIRTEMVAGIKSAFDQAVALVKSVDWGGVADSLKVMLVDAWNFAVDAFKSTDWGGVWDTLVDSIGGAWDSIYSWFTAQDWAAIGKEAGRLIGEALVGGIDLLGDISEWAYTGLASLLGGPAIGQANAGGTALGNSAKSGFTSAFGAFGDEVNRQLSRININWGVLLTGISGIAELIGMHIYNAIATAVNNIGGPLGALIGEIPLKTDVDLNEAKNKVLNAGWSTLVTVDPDIRKVKGVLEQQKWLINAGIDVTKLDTDVTTWATAKEVLVKAGLDPVAADKLLTDVKNHIDNNGAGHDTKGNLTNGELIKNLVANNISNFNNGHNTTANLTNGAALRATAQSFLQGLAATATLSVTEQRYVQIIQTTGSPYIGAQAQSASGGVIKAMGAGGIVHAAYGGVSVIEGQADRYGVISRGPTLVMAGEAGDEAFIPLKGGKVPVSLNGRGGSGGATVYNINVSGIKMEDVAAEVMRKIRMKESLRFSRI